MNILGIDTTTKEASVSLLKDKTIITKSISNEVTHSEKLLPLIDKTLKENNVTLKDIDLYACINGPGSFTGIRIGLSTIKAFTFIDGKKIFSISSLDLISLIAYKQSKYFKNKDEATVISIIDARNNRVYYTVNRLFFDNKIKKIVIENIEKNSNCDIGDLISNKKNKYKNLVISGDCVENYKDKLKEIDNNLLLYNIYPTTKDLILAYNEIEANEKYFFDTYTLDANYVRSSQAERMLKNE